MINTGIIISTATTTHSLEFDSLAIIQHQISVRITSMKTSMEAPMRPKEGRDFVGFFFYDKSIFSGNAPLLCGKTREFFIENTSHKIFEIFTIILIVFFGVHRELPFFHLYILLYPKISFCQKNKGGICLPFLFA